MLFSCLVLSIFVATVSARTALELQGVNFELALTSYKYAAILFYDSSSQGKVLVEQWQKAAERFNDSDDIHDDGEIAMVSIILLTDHKLPLTQDMQASYASLYYLHVR